MEERMSEGENESVEREKDGELGGMTMNRKKQSQSQSGHSLDDGVEMIEFGNVR